MALWTTTWNFLRLYLRKTTANATEVTTTDRDRELLKNACTLPEERALMFTMASWLKAQFPVLVVINADGDSQQPTPEVVEPPAD
jgi:hypothetical protein